MQIHLLFDTYLFDYMHSKDHVYGTATRVEATLGFKEVAPRDTGNEPVEEDAGQDISSNGKQGNALVISAV